LYDVPKTYFLSGIVNPVGTVKKLNRIMAAYKARERILWGESSDNSCVSHECYVRRGSRGKNE
jgi:hypothetical protein